MEKLWSALTEGMAAAAIEGGYTRRAPLPRPTGPPPGALSGAGVGLRSRAGLPALPAPPAAAAVPVAAPTAAAAAAPTYAPTPAPGPVPEFAFEAEVAEAEAAMRRSAPAGPEELDDPPLSDPPRKPSTRGSSSSWFSRKKDPSSFSAPTPANSRNSSVDPAPASTAPATARAPSSAPAPAPNPPDPPAAPAHKRGAAANPPAIGSSVVLGSQSTSTDAFDGVAVAPPVATMASLSLETPAAITEDHAAVREDTPRSPLFRNDSLFDDDAIAAEQTIAGAIAAARAEVTEVDAPHSRTVHGVAPHPSGQHEPTAPTPEPQRQPVPELQPQVWPGRYCPPRHPTHYYARFLR